MERRIQEYINKWESRCYKGGIPDEVPVELREMVPSYKLIALAILNNDHSLKSLGFNPPHSIYYDALKRIEIQQRVPRLNK